MVKVTLYKIVGSSKAPHSHSFMCDDAKVATYGMDESLVITVDDVEIEIPFPMKTTGFYINGNHWNSFTLEPDNSEQ